MKKFKVVGIKSHRHSSCNEDCLCNILVKKRGETWVCERGCISYHRKCPACYFGHTLLETVTWTVCRDGTGCSKCVILLQEEDSEAKYELSLEIKELEITEKLLEDDAKQFLDENVYECTPDNIKKYIEEHIKPEIEAGEYRPFCTLAKQLNQVTEFTSMSHVAVEPTVICLDLTKKKFWCQLFKFKDTSYVNITVCWEKFESCNQ